MRLFLIRHAQAGDRAPGGRDLYRQLSAEGHLRAEELARLLSDCGVARVMASPATRCVQTVEPLAQVLGLEIEEQPDLWEGSSIPHVIALLEQQEASAVAVCTHGDIIPQVVESLAELGVPTTGRGCEKGSVWVLDHEDGNWTSARYLDRSVSVLPDA